MVTCGALMYVICYCVCDKTRTCSVLIKEAFHCSSLRHRSYLVNDALDAWGVIHYWLFGGGEKGRMLGIPVFARGDLDSRCII